jgi:hypothetical protein
MHTVIYDYIETLDIASGNDIELFKHFLCEQLSELQLTAEQLDYMSDKAWGMQMEERLNK